MRGGRLLAVGLPGPRLDAATERLLARLEPGGVILFGHNVESPEQLAGLTRAVRRLLPEAVLWLDAEGGPVDRLRHLAGPAPAGSALAARPPALARRAGRWVGHALRRFGFDADFAPVVDLDRGHRGNALDGRTLGATARGVTARARAFLEGLHGGGIGGCLKHFPGLGAATADTHLAEAPIALPASELEADLAPFHALAPLAAAVMAGHAVYPALDPRKRPASLSPVLLADLLRGRLGFRGVVVADDLEMEALAAWGGLAERAEAALAAGCDLLLVCSRLEEARGVAERLERPALAARRAEATERLDAYRRHLQRLRAAAPGRRFGLAALRRRLAAVTLAAGPGPALEDPTRRG